MLCCTLAIPAAATAADDAHVVKEYIYTVDADQAALLADQGVEIDHYGWDQQRKGPQRVAAVLYGYQAEELRQEGVIPTSVGKMEAARKMDTGGDSPNPYYDVYRTYSEPGGIADEMRALAAANRENVKLVRIGTSVLGKPILALKLTNDARNVQDGTRKAILFSAVNHAREWIAAEVGRRMPRWWIDHQNDPEIAEMLKTTELWFLPIMNPDGYDYTFTCGVGANNRPCGHGATDVDGTPLAQPTFATNRLWRKNLRDNNGNGIHGDSIAVNGVNVGDGVDPNRNYPTAWGLDEEGASHNPSSGTYRGPYPLSEPENLANDRLFRRMGVDAVINYHSAAQLLLYPFGYITDVYADDNPWFVALTGTDGDAAVDPYTSQRSSDLYVTNGETTDHAYNKYQAMSWTPELDECETAGGQSDQVNNVQWCSGGSGFTFPDNEGKVAAVFDKNLDFARNVVETMASERPDRPKNATEDESTYQVKATPDIEANRFAVSYGSQQPVEANVRRALGPVDVQYSVVSGPGGGSRTVVVRAQEYRGGERYGDLRGRFYHRVRAVNPADFRQTSTQTARPLVAGDVVNVTIRAGGQQQRFTYRIQSTQQDAAKRRVLVVAAEDYTGASPNKSEPYDAAPRYVDEHVSALQAAGYEVEVYNVDAPPAGGSGTAPKIVSTLGVLNHFDAVLYYTGDDLVPQEITEPNQRRAGTPNATTGAFGLTGSLHLAQWGVRNAQNLRDYLNEGGKLVISGRNAWVPFTSTGTGLQSYSGYGWWQDAQYGFDYPANQAGDDDRPHTAFFRELDVSNDFGQYFLGIAARQGGYGSTTYNAAAVNPATGGIFEGMPPVVLDTTPAGDPNETADNTPDPRAKSPTRLRAYSSVALQRPFRQERVELDYATTPAPTNVGGAAISTRDTIAFGFGLEQVDQATREQLVARSFQYLLPVAADTTAPTVDWLRPGADAEVTPADPVEIEVEAVDERGDIKEVRLKVGGQLVATKVSFPFQFRWQPTMADVGTTRTLTVEAEDAAGNVQTSTRDVKVVAPAATVESPLPVANPTMTGTPVVGETLTCNNGGFLNAPDSYTFEWLSNGMPIVGATGASYIPVMGDVGTQIACRITAVNSAGDADATSDSRTVGTAAAGPAGGGGSNGPAGPAGPAGPPGPGGTPGRVPNEATGRATLIGRTFNVRNGRLTLRVKCPEESESVCNASVKVRTLTKIGGVRRTLGTVSFQAAAGDTRRTTLILNRRIARLMKGKRIRALAFIVYRDEDGRAKATQTSLTLKG